MNCITEFSKKLKRFVYSFHRFNNDYKCVNCGILIKKGVIIIKKYRVTFSQVVEAENRDKAMEEFMDMIGVEDSDYDDIAEFKADVEVVRV